MLERMRGRRAAGGAPVTEASAEGIPEEAQATVKSWECPMCGGHGRELDWDCDPDDDGVCQARITEEEILIDCDLAKRPYMAEALVSLRREGRISVRRCADGRICGGPHRPTGAAAEVLLYFSGVWCI